MEIAISLTFKNYDAEENGPPGRVPPMFVVSPHPHHAQFQHIVFRFANNIYNSASTCKNAWKKWLTAKIVCESGLVSGEESACYRAFRESSTV